MAFNQANHLVVSGAGIEGTVDLTSVSGENAVSLSVDGEEMHAPRLETTREGIVVRAIHEEIPDSHTVVVTITIPQINLDSEPQAGAGFAVLATVRTSMGGPGLVSGPLQLYDIRPLAVTGSIIES